MYSTVFRSLFIARCGVRAVRQGLCCTFVTLRSIIQFSFIAATLTWHDTQHHSVLLYLRLTLSTAQSLPTMASFCRTTTCFACYPIASQNTSLCNTPSPRLPSHHRVAHLTYLPRLPPQRSFILLFVIYHVINQLVSRIYLRETPQLLWQRRLCTRPSLPVRPSSRRVQPCAQ